jgi:hypothetical protein
VDDNGNLQFVYSDDLVFLSELGKPTTKRASHVEPVIDGWTADMSPVGGPFLGPFTLRSQALAEEVEWLKENIL